MLVLIRYVWASPGTLIGLSLTAVALATGGRARVVSGVLEAHGGWISRFLNRGVWFVGPVAAITFGHVVLGGSPAWLEASRTHERVHVRQYERWGPAFLPAYLLCSVWLWTRGRDPYRENPFEIEAYASEDVGG